jgi:hypothetical protein
MRPTLIKILQKLNLLSVIILINSQNIVFSQIIFSLFYFIIKIILNYYYFLKKNLFHNTFIFFSDFCQFIPEILLFAQICLSKIFINIFLCICIRGDHRTTIESGGLGLKLKTWSFFVGQSNKNLARVRAEGKADKA